MSKKINLGLKGQLSYTLHNYSSIRAILRNIKWELREAWQRAWRGYDDPDIFNFDESFRDRMVICLEELDKTRHCLFTVPKEYQDQFKIDDEFGIAKFSDEQTSAIIQTIIFHLKMSNTDYVEKQLYGKNIYDDDYDWKIKTIDDYKKIEIIRKQNQDMAFDLLKMFWDQLWD